MLKDVKDSRLSVNNGSDNWDDEADMIVVGFGGAGACAAIEAADRGSSVLVVERFNGGGATRRSGGVVYAGGGTPYQEEAGFNDTPDNMFNYLEIEVQDVLSKETLRSFCEGSCDDLSWLEAQGVRFGSSMCPTKTSYPPDQCYLYYSGNETVPSYSRHATPAPRGHRAWGKGLTGNALFQPLKESARKKGVRIRYSCKAKRLIVGENGNVIGLEFSYLPWYDPRALIHRVIGYGAYQLRNILMIVPGSNNILKILFRLLELGGRTTRVRARQGVILAAGGFVFNRRMMERYAPAYIGGVPLGTIADDGSGIELGRSVGGATAYMDRISAWRFITPPEILIKGIMVDSQGVRICNEQLYGAKLGECMVEQHGGKAKLIIDAEIWNRARRSIGGDKTSFFQTLLALVNLYINRKKAKSIEKLAQRCGIPADNLRDTVETYNKFTRGEKEDPLGKAPQYLQPIASPPYFAIDCSLKNSLSPCAMLSLGGLVVNEESGEVKREDGSVIDGLYAAGRNAVGIPSRGYVSGLAIADCVFSARRAAAHAAMKDKK
ncbi:MAG: FAD-binding protein [Dehalococcoidia bacterium]|nr:MAG: FAD-binding protein [Dehalococcoidia bacterium]